MCHSRITRLIQICFSLCLMVANHLAEEMVTKTNDLVLNDLNARAFVYERKLRDNEKEKFINFNITWNAGNLLNDSKYDVYVKSEERYDAENITVRECLADCYELDLIVKGNFVSFPTKRPDYTIDNDKCIFVPQCTYIIEVKSKEVRTEMVYQIPACVENICSCHQHRHLIPTPIIEPEITESQVSFHWKVDQINIPPDITLNHLSINIGVLRSENLWNYESVEAEVHEMLTKDNGLFIKSGVYTKSLIMTPGKRMIIRVRIVDSRGCIGEDAVYPLKVPVPDPQRSKIHYDLVVFLLIGLFGMMASLVMIFFVWKFKKRSRLYNNWRGVYRNIHVQQHIPMQQNLLYIDKDIMEARIRGAADLLEIPHSSISIGREIGKGAFGRVFIARVDGLGSRPGGQIVAIKQLKKNFNPDQLEEFLSEIYTMKKVGYHDNVVSLIGCCTIKPPLCMVMEFVACGDLLQYLRKVRAKHEAQFARVPQNGMIHRASTQSNSTLKNSTSSNSQILGPLGKYLEVMHSHSSSSNSDSASYITQLDALPFNERPSVSDTMYTNLSINPDTSTLSSSNTLEYVVSHTELHNFAIQISRGMRHLEEKQITHRDLAARNILISFDPEQNCKILKISDFGLSRAGIYVNTKNKKVPLRWLSVEAIRDNLYSSKSDVWAFAVVLWEIGTLGGFPYPTLANQELLLFLQNENNRLEKPENCSDTLYNLMMQCWNGSPEKRPSFDEICRILEPQKARIYIDFSELGPNYVFPPTSEEMKNNPT